LTKKGHRASRSRRIQSLRPRRQIVPICKRTHQQLTPMQRRIREKSLEALSLVRRERLSLRETTRHVGLDSETIRNNTNAFRKIHGRWRAKPFDRIPRTMVIYEKGRKVIVEIADSRTASLIGEYHNRVKQFLETGRSSFLRKLPRKRFRDIKGKTHTLETDPKAIFRIKSREPTPEFFEIYRR
jgi:predicted DNA-binding protein (UPF0251 family)